MSETDRNSSRRKSILVTLAVAWVGVSLAISAVQFFHERRLEQKARQWFSQAQEDAKATWKEDDAARWLDDHGIEAYRGEGSGPDGRYYVVQGYHEIEAEGRIFGPASVRIEFCFGLDHQLQRVRYEVWPFHPPTNKPAQRDAKER